MKRLFKSICIFSLLASSSHSAENIRFTQILNTQKNLLELVKENTFQDVIDQEWLCITQVSANDDKVNLQFAIFDPEYAGLDWKFTWFYSLRFYIRKKTSDLIFLDCIKGKPQLGQTIANLSLEIPEAPQSIDPSISLTINILDILTMDSHKEKIGGLVRWETTTEPSTDYWGFYSHFSVHLWDAKTGKQLFYQKYPHKVVPNSTPSTKIIFSPKDRFLIANQMYKAYNYRDLFNNCTPTTALLDTQTMQFITTVDRDVAFTSDERYYCTHRDGVPSLVDAQNHEVLFQYKTSVPMTACCFSPDNRKLYIACEDLNVYEFDSHVPLSAVADWEIYGKK